MAEPKRKRSRKKAVKAPAASARKLSGLLPRIEKPKEILIHKDDVVYSVTDVVFCSKCPPGFSEGTLAVFGTFKTLNKKG